ncbi:PREDICTED: uncharacterized protein LOC104809973 isoform X2 [Tarenaya hassleriana]|uniref:uncharacterized protein LOC104809973 isoform X2 n=1 Tax=Tarenaya hassleriana TaxID=28532 RepID=UPI00053C8FA9|nr:PREDICTED: uncharacterized protein LOC104809973 isoform X2 [Tarenaya hassleriana]
MMRSKSIVSPAHSNTAATSALTRSASGVANPATSELRRSVSGVEKPQKKSAAAVMEFPVSPQLILGEEMVHFGHPQHVAAKVELPDLYTCSGCKEDGAGKRYVCQQCDYQLHEFCALAPPLLKAHPFHYQHHLLFYAKPSKGGIVKSKCDVCGRTPKGYTFRCKACGFQMHPCCAMLSPTISFSGHPNHALKLLPAGGDGGGNYVCGECKRGKRSGRVYRCTVCEYHLHAVCAKEMVNGLRANGLKSKSPAVLGTAAKLASQVVIDFLGGIMEGIGEGVGEAFLDGVTRGGNGPARIIPRGRGG